MGSERITQEWLPSWVPEDWAGTYLKGRAFADEIEAVWISLLLRFDLSKQRELLARLGMEEVAFRALPVFLLLSLVLVMAVIYFLDSRRREPLAIEERLYRQLCTTVKRRWALDKTPEEGPLTLLARVQGLGPQGAAAEQALHSLIVARFGRNPLSAKQIRELRQQIQKL